MGGGVCSIRGWCLLTGGSAPGEGGLSDLGGGGSLLPGGGTVPSLLTESQTPVKT